MKMIRMFLAALLVLELLTAQPVTSFAASLDEEGLDTAVKCTVEPVYSFSAPSSVIIHYPQCDVLAGKFGVGDLLLVGGERLTVSLVQGRLVKKDDPQKELPYTVLFYPPASLDESQSGEMYDIMVKIDHDAFFWAPPGEYISTLLFQVKSNLTDGPVWQGVTTITVDKPETGAVSLPTIGGSPKTDDAFDWWWVLLMVGAGASLVFLLKRKGGTGKKTDQ